MKKIYPIKAYFQADQFRVKSWVGLVFAILLGTFFLSEWLVAEISLVVLFVIYSLLFFPILANIRDKAGFKMQFIAPLPVLTFGWMIVSLEQMPLHHEILVLTFLI